MITTPAPSMTRALDAEQRQRLMLLAREVSFPQGARIFEEGARADRFWIVRTGTVELDMRVPGRRPVVIESLRHNELLGWSWLFSPHVWHLGAEAMTPAGRCPSGSATSSPTACAARARGCWTCTPPTAPGPPSDRRPRERPMGPVGPSASGPGER